MDEVPGARERPGATKIQIAGQGGDTVIRVPAQGLSIPLIALGVLDVGGLITFVVALILFILERHSFFGVRDLLPTDNTPTQHWKWVIVASWVALIALGCYVLLFILRISYQSETLRFGTNGLVWTTRAPGRRSERAIPYSAVSAFQLARDPTGMRRSRLLLLTPPSPEAPAEEEYAIFEGATEEEKSWLESVCNVLLVRYRPRAA